MNRDFTLGLHVFNQVSRQCLRSLLLERLEMIRLHDPKFQSLSDSIECQSPDTFGTGEVLHVSKAGSYYLCSKVQVVSIDIAASWCTSSHS